MIISETNHRDIAPGQPRGAPHAMSGPPPPNGANFMGPPPDQDNNMMPMSESLTRFDRTRPGPDEGLHSLRLEGPTGGRHRGEMDSYREFDRNSRIRDEELVYQGWTLKRAKGPSSDGKPTWAHVDRSRMNLSQDKLIKLSRKKVSPSVSQQYRKMGPERRSQLENLIDACERQDQRYDWTCIFSEPTYGADKYGILGSKLAITAMDVVLEGRPKYGVGSPSQNMSMDMRRPSERLDGPPRFEQENRRSSFPPEPPPPGPPPQGHAQFEPHPGSIRSDGPPPAGFPPQTGRVFDDMPPDGLPARQSPPGSSPGGMPPDGFRRPPQGPMQDGPPPGRMPNGGPPHFPPPGGPRQESQPPIQQRSRPGGMANDGPPHMHPPEPPHFPPNEPNQQGPRFNNIPPGGAHDHQGPPPPPPPPPSSGQNLVQPPPRRSSPSPPRGGPPQHSGSGPPPMAPPPPLEGPRGTKPICPPQHSPPPLEQESPRYRQSPKQGSHPYPQAPHEDPMLQDRGSKHKQPPRLPSERNWSSPKDSRRYEVHSDGDSSFYDDDSLIESDPASSATGDMLLPEEFEREMKGHGGRTPRAHSQTPSPHRPRSLSGRPKIHHMHTEPPRERHQSEDVDVIPFRSAHRAPVGRTKSVAYPPRVPRSSTFDGLQLQRAPPSAFDPQALSPPVGHMGSPFMDEILRERRLWERQQQEVAEGLRHLNMRDRRLKEKEEEIRDREIDLSRREKGAGRDQRAVVPRQMVEQLPGYHERSGRPPVERHQRHGMVPPPPPPPPPHPRECY